MFGVQTVKMAMQPIKPTRKKYIKETSGCGLLVSVIKTLDASETNEQRDHEKLKIEKEFKKSDQKLNLLVSKHDGDLTQVMQLFGKVSTQISSSRERIHAVKTNLQDCKQLLRCRREELKKLWMDAVQNKYLLEMLDQVNDLQKISSQINGHLSKKHYLHATKTLVTALQISEGQLRGVEGLTDLRNDFSNKKQMLYTKLIEELNKHLYQTSTQELLNSFQRQNSTKTSAYTSPFQRTVLRKSAERIEANSKAKKALFDISQNGYIDVDKSEIIEDTDLLDPDINSTYFIGIIVECFALLQKVPDSIETIKVQMQNELLTIVSNTTHHLLLSYNAIAMDDNASVGNSSPKLLELLELLFKQFKLIADAHTLTIKNYCNVIKRNSLQMKPYDISDFWNQVQSVYQLVLTDYLDIQNANVDDQMRTGTASAFPEQTLNVNTFFNRRKLQSKKTLFKFDKSSHSQTQQPEEVVTTTVKEHRRNLSNVSASKEEAVGPGVVVQHLKSLSLPGDSKKVKREKVLVCVPDQNLVRAVYLPMMNYVQEIEQLMKAKMGQPSTLNAFLTNYVKETFLARGHSRSLQITVESLAKTQDAWRSIINPEDMKRYGLTRPLLQSTVMVENKITETKKLIQDLPSYSDDLLKMVCSLLKTYRETCQAAYRGIVQPETEDKRIYSVAWLKDEDISRFLKTLPNWTDLKSAKARMKQRRLKSEPSEEESPTQVQQRNIREAEMLTSNLGEGGISQQEILSDIGVLKELAILQESMEWFANRITDFANDLRNPIVNGLAGSPELSAPIEIKGGTIKVLTNLALEFDELANTCLLVLHLEVRVQCFHYLRLNPLDKQKSYNKADSLEPDSKVLRLTKILSDMDEALSSTLHPRKTKYIFEGLAHLASRILIMASLYMESIDTAGIQRMCRNANAMQQTLSSITASREVSLDQARNFYEMFYMNPDDFLTSIVEKGAQFTEMQYLNALQLICKSYGITDSNSLLTYQQKLSDILGTKTALGIMV